MKHRLPILFLGASMAALAACATTPAPEPAPVAPAAQPVAAPAPEKSAHDRLFKLFKDSDEAKLKRNPIIAHLPRRPALCRPARRLHHRRIFRRRRRAAARPISPRCARSTARPLNADRPARLRRVRISRPRTRCGATSPNSGADQGSPDQPFLRLPHLLSDLRQRQGRGAVQDGRRL